MLQDFKSILTNNLKDKGAIIITERKGIFSGDFNFKKMQEGDEIQINKMLNVGFEILYDIYSLLRPIVTEVPGHEVT